MKIDVSVQSYKKPELLLYTLLSLRQHSSHHIENVWINDDLSDPWVMDFYRSGEFLAALSPWRVHVRQNTRRMGWWYLPVEGLNPKYMTPSRKISQWWKHRNDNDFFIASRENIRYQWAIDNTDKPFLYLIHDDMVFHKDVLGLYLQTAANMKQPSIVGDLGQCWWCERAKNGCTPERLSSGLMPDESWPLNLPEQTGYWPCRINEWSALLSVQAARQIEAKHQILFGNYNNKGDIGAYWFAMAHQDGFQFMDPLPTAELRNRFYLHADGGSGHSVWVDQGSGKKIYDRSRLIQLLKSDFGFLWSEHYGP